jgi:hypothetical protein
MASTKRTWIWVVLGILATCVFVVLVFIVGAVVEFRRHVKNEYVESTVAEQEFAQTRARFAGQQPLIEFTGRGRSDDSLVHRPPENAPRVKINNLRVLVYDLQQGHLIHADVPGWLLRMMPDSGRYGGGGFNTEFDDEFTHHRLTLEDLERHGLGLVLEGRNDHTRILMWTE